MISYSVSGNLSNFERNYGFLFDSLTILVAKLWLIEGFNVYPRLHGFHCLNTAAVFVTFSLNALTCNTKYRVSTFFIIVQRLFPQTICIPKELFTYEHDCFIMQSVLYLIQHKWRDYSQNVHSHPCICMNASRFIVFQNCTLINAEKHIVHHTCIRILYFVKLLLSNISSLT